MGITHHLTDETLSLYAAGALPRAMETIVACHLTLCVACRDAHALHEGVGGAVLHEGAPAAVRGSAADVIARAGRASANDAAATGCRHAPSPGVPRPLGRLLPAPLETLAWHRMAPGIRQYNLKSGSRLDGAFKLLHCAPGIALSAHTHNERELTFIVSGSYTDALGRFGPGDVADLDDTVEHRPVIDEGGPCVALIATDAPVHYTDLLGKLMQPFVGI